MLCKSLLIPKKYSYFIFISRNYVKNIKTHYEVLEIELTANQKEIKNAFHKLSKKHHPDTNTNSKKCHIEFMRINEAYMVLSNLKSRHVYDMKASTPSHSSASQESSSSTSNITETAEYWHAQTTSHSSDPNNEHSYYGIKGLRKQPNKVVLLIPFTLFLLGCVYFYAAFSYYKYKLKKERDIFDLQNDSFFKKFQPITHKVDIDDK